MTDKPINAPLPGEDFSEVDRLCWTWHDAAQLDKCLKNLAKQAAAITAVPNVGLFLIEEETGKIRLRASMELTAAEKEAARKEVARVLSRNAPVMISDGFTTVAIKADGKFHGALTIRADDPPTEESLLQLHALAERAALAIARAHQCDEVFARLSIIDNLLAMSKAVVDEGDLSRALQMVAERAAKAIKAELTTVGLIDRRTKELHYVQSYGKLASSVTGARIPLTRSLRSLISKSGRPILINDVTQDDRVPKEAVEEWGIRSLIIVPMKIGRRLIGVLLAANRHGRSFDTRDIRVFEAIANHGAAAVAHAEHHTFIKSTLGELEAEKTKIEAVLAQLGDGVVVSDSHGKVIIMNSAAERILSLPSADVIGKNFIEMHPPVFRKEVELTLKMLQESDPESGVFWEQNISLPWGKVVRINIRPVFLKTGAFIGTATVMQDVTAQVELDEAKSEFISIVAHELRTPLTVLKGSLGLILAGASGKVEPSLTELLGIAQNNCNRLIRLVDDMLDMAKIETGHLSFDMEILAVQDRVLSAVKQMRHYAEGKQVQIVSKVIGQPPSVVADGDRVEQVVTNLIANAIKFAPPKSIIEVAISHIRGFVTVSVRDQGPGIPESERAKIFEKFYRIHSPGSSRDGGSGLGLAICKAIVEQHGGNLYVKSVIGMGSKFTFQLPIPGEETLLSDE